MFPHAPFEATVWRVVRESRDVTQCSSSGGRWDDGTFDVLYTSLDRDGAIAEMYYHLLRGQPVFPSKAPFKLYELRVALKATMRLPTLPELKGLGLDVVKYGQLSYAERIAEYPRTQEIAEVTHFLDCDGLMVPNARWPCTNLVIFGDRIEPDTIDVVHDHGIIAWHEWRKTNMTHLSHGVSS
ncbi:RES family NAD+ phosphorylase [Mesorhizobium sp. M0615]|uniref:RES family NAD+ phosphorylase n=1 Tax=Mesorhizobium sp. M0615 TaxID=2956971 RepID=UPI00333B3CD9